MTRRNSLLRKKGRLVGYAIAVAALGSIAASSFVIAPTTAVHSIRVPTVERIYPHSIHVTLGIGGGPISTWGARTDSVVDARSLFAQQSSHQNFDYDPNQRHDKSFFAKAADKVKSFLPIKFRDKDDETRRGELERRHQRMEIRQEMKQAFRGAPFPIRAVGSMISSGVGKVMGKEGRKAEVLLRDAQRLIGADETVCYVLGEPITTGRILSQSSSIATINGKKSIEIEASFEVKGSRQSGIATMVANKYQKGGIELLRVHVGRRSHDIDV
jgi:hypothetical protein